MTHVPLVSELTTWIRDFAPAGVGMIGGGKKRGFPGGGGEESACSCRRQEMLV